MSDLDDLPDLVESSDDDCARDNKTNKNIVDHAETWLQKGSNYLKRQETWIRVFVLAPFLYGVNNVVSAAWIKALFNAKLLLNENRQHSIDFLEWKEWDCVDLVDQVVTIVIQHMKSKTNLVKMLECVPKLEECRSGVIIDVDLAITEAEQVDEIADMWRTILKDPVSSGKEKSAKFAVLYACKLYREHVISQSELSIDFVDTTKSEFKKNNNLNKGADEKKREGNEYFKSENYPKSIECYTEASKKDPFHHIFYGNRAQAYNKLKKFSEALADGRRAVVIKPDFAKGHYRYAVAFFELGQLDNAIRVNEKGLELCQPTRADDVKNVDDLEEQGVKFKQERNDTKHKLTRIPGELSEHLDKLEIESNTGIDEKCMGYKVPPFKKLGDGVPDLVDSDSDDSRSQAIITDRKVRRKKHKPQKGEVERKENKQQDMPKGHSSKEKQKMSPTSTKLQNGIASEPVQKSKAELQRDKLQEEGREILCAQLEGSHSYLKEEAPKAAMVSYQKALDILHHTEAKDNFGLDESDIVTLKYAFGFAAISTGIHKNILDGIDKFNEIIHKHENIKFPMAFFGLGKAYVTLNRFPDAIVPLKSGVQIAKNVRSVPVTWPGTNTKIEENDATVLIDKMKELLQLCKFPPTPDAVCRYHTDDTDSRTVIYLSDPDFKGYIKIVCQMDCVVTFHTVCWKTYKAGRNKQNDKDVLDMLCPTPDCIGFIIKIDVVYPNTVSKQHISEKHIAIKDQRDKKPMQKQKTSNESKIAKKQEKKEIRKQKKRQHKEDRVDESEDEIPDGASASALVEEIMANTDAVLPDVKHSKVLKKDDLKQNKPIKKSKKKKDKQPRQFLQMEVNFTDDGKTLENENTVLSDDEKNQQKSSNVGPSPFSVPSKLQTQMNSFEKSYAGNAKQLFKPDEITENLFSYFVDILQAHGPITITDPKIQQELEVFPAEALEKIKQVGGLGDFLRQSLKFAVIDDVISLMSDAKRAREVALCKRGESGSVQASTVNAWKTVGKGVNNSDGLSESIAGEAPLPKTNHTLPNVSPALSYNSSSVVNDATFALAASSSSSSVSSLGNSSFPPVSTVSQQHWSSGANSFNAKTLQPKQTELDGLDSIDDFPVAKQTYEPKNQYDDLDDFDNISDSSSVYKNDKEKIGVPKTNRSGSKSDISEKSFRSDFSSELMPKPLRSINGLAGNAGISKNSKMWDTLETDFVTSWSDVKKEDLDNIESGADLVSREIREATEEFVRESDEKFVSELAASVVEKMYRGKNVSETDRKLTLNSVSSDIWKDFEKSAHAGTKMGRSGLWENTPAGADYSNNMGKFATSFMKKHYQKSDGHSPTSNINIVYPQKSPSPLDSVHSSQSNYSGLNSPITPLMSTTNDNTSSQSQTVVADTPSTSTSASSESTNMANNSGFNLFSSPWSFDPFTSSSSTSGMNSGSTAAGPRPNLPQFIRPPMSASAYYNSGMPMPPLMPPCSMPPNMRMPFPPPNMSPQMFRMPQPGMFPPGAPMPHPEMKEKETQVPAIIYRTIETMTDEYEPYKAEFLNTKEERDQMSHMMNEYKSKYEAVLQNLNSLQQRNQDLETELSNKVSKYDQEKRNWKDEKNSFSEKIRQLNLQISSSEVSERELKVKMEGQETRVHELAAMAKDQRDKDLQEIRKFIDTSEQYRQQMEAQSERAKTAELEIIQSKLQSSKGMNERKLKESTHYLQYLQVFVKKHKDDNRPIPDTLQQSVDFCTGYIKQLEDTVQKVKSEYEQQISAVENGRPLSELQPVNVPSPPAMPDHLKAFSLMGSPGQGMGSMPGVMMPRGPTPFQNRPPFTQQLGIQGPTLMSTAAPVSNVPVTSSTPTYITQPSRPAGTLPPTPAPLSSLAAKPKPLTQPSLATGVPRPLRPLAGARAPLTGLGGPARPPLRPLGLPPGMQQPLSSFEKLIVKLQMVFPNRNKSEFSPMIQELRKQRGGSLSGMTIEDIISQVSQIIKHMDKQHVSLSTSTAGQPAPITGPHQSVPVITGPPGLSGGWAFPGAGLAGATERGPPRGEDVFQDEEDPCVICHEEMASYPAVNLQCGHKFHDECIRKWFQEQSTCPNCRVHTLLVDDFPSLG